MYAIDSSPENFETSDPLRGNNFFLLPPGAVSIDFDMKNKKIYWTDILSDQIQSADVETGRRRSVSWHSQQNKSVVMKHVHTPDGLALDWINDKLYWTGKFLMFLSLFH